MGIFGKIKEKTQKILEKKPCSICGTEVGPFSRSALKDGLICGSCKKKLSPFYSFTGYETVESINEQLAYRAASKATYAQMKVTKVFGENAKVQVDEYQGKFAVFASSDAAIPEILDFDQVKNCALEIGHSSVTDVREVKGINAEGKSVSFDPKRYAFDYKMSIKMEVEHPYFSQMSFSLLPGNFLTVEVTEYPGFNKNTFNPRVDNAFCINEKKCEEFVAYMNSARRQSLQSKGAEYAKNDTVVPNIVITADAINSVNHASVSASAVSYCSNCGSKVTGGKFCSNCGAKL